MDSSKGQMARIKFTKVYILLCSNANTGCLGSKDCKDHSLFLPTLLDFVKYLVSHK